MTQVRRKPAYTPDDPLLDVREVAAHRGQGVSTIWLAVKKGDLPKPVYVGPRSPRWSKSAIEPRA
jgi:predicted DNA-binding transcriptional regulator AlpA